jgi:hypothetical protein
VEPFHYEKQHDLARYTYTPTAKPPTASVVAEIRSVVEVKEGTAYGQSTPDITVCPPPSTSQASSYAVTPAQVAIATAEWPEGLAIEITSEIGKQVGYKI